MRYRIKAVSGAVAGAALLLAQAGTAMGDPGGRPAAPGKGDFRIASAADGRCLAPRAAKGMLDLSLITCGSQGATDVFGLKPHAERFQLRSDAKKGCLGINPARKLMFPSCSVKQMTDWTFTKHGAGYQIRRPGTDPSRGQLRGAPQQDCVTEILDRKKGDRVALKPCSLKDPRQIWKLTEVRQAAAAQQQDPVQQPQNGKQEPAKPEPGHHDAAKPEPAKQDATKQDATKPASGHHEAAKPDHGKPAAAKPEPGHHDAAKQQPGHHEAAAQPEAAKPEEAKPAGTQPHVAKPAGA
ncbi:hypothetical protein [Streptomyces purpurogeneiscleroticus]|uniref:hypothetical protein n=1 Tax=Streptomyces purpurogeneiscleroticus TaxID=68259 RepID=UPI001CBA7954|nr:hypothetical protein [Streptomyces purpurogeneiscleroticus]MBZ4019191.1 hypothetical protein [Streptomyces purpurogeneiscleroticus]